jgi:hypothetical protein
VLLGYLRCASRVSRAHRGGRSHNGRRLADSRAMSSHAAELSSLQSQLDDLLTRISAIAGVYEGTTRDDLLGALYEIERALRAARAQVARARQLV